MSTAEVDSMNFKTCSGNVAFTIVTVLKRAAELQIMSSLKILREQNVELVSVAQKMYFLVKG